MQPPVPISIMKNLKCGHCRKFVTCGPVHVTPDSSVLCGRCARYAKKTYRNTAFEAAASMYRYPCCYWSKHCNKKLAWNEALDHERNCLFQSGCNVFCSRPGTFFKSERKLPNSTEMHFEHVPDNILEELKCVACENYLSNAPVYVFVDGKNVCHRCCHSNGVPKGAVRNLAYETLASGIIFPCIYRYRGCPIRLKFGREMWGHESECSYGQVSKRLSKKPSKVIGKDGKEKERGVIETHSGHIWGTITPHSALFAPPKAKNNDGKMVTQELTEIMKKKNEETKTFDSQSMDSIDSVGDNISRSTADNISRSTVDNISRSTVDNISRDNVSRSSSRVPVGPRQFKIPRPNDDFHPHFQSSEEVTPIPTPPGYNKVPHNGYYEGRQPNVDPYAYLYHYPPILYYDNDNNQPPRGSFATPKRTESLRVGNQDIIDELKMRQNKKHSFNINNNNNNNNNNNSNKDNNPYGQCNNLQDIVQKHDEVSH